MFLTGLASPVAHRTQSQAPLLDNVPRLSLPRRGRRREPIDAQETNIEQEAIGEQKANAEQEAIVEQDVIPQQDVIPEQEAIVERDFIPQHHAIPEQDTIAEQDVIPQQDAIPKQDAIAEQEPGTICMICLDECGRGQETLSCSHQFHSRCINTWLQEHLTCPICRALVGIPQPPVMLQPYIYVPQPAASRRHLMVMAYVTISIISLSFLCHLLIYLSLLP